MRATKRVEPTVPAAEIRARDKSLKLNLIVLVSLCSVTWLLGELFRGDAVIFYVAVPIFVSYLLFCRAFGRLAGCFGESASSWALTAFFFSVFGLALAYFAFKDEVIKAHRENP